MNSSAAFDERAATHARSNIDIATRYGLPMDRDGIYSPRHASPCPPSSPDIKHRRHVARSALLATWVIVVGLGAGFERDLFAQPPGLPPQPVSVGEVELRAVQSGQSFVGTVLPARMSTIGSAVDGRLVEFRVDEGDYVRKGDVIAQLLTGTIKIELSEARAQLATLQAELRELEAGARPEEIEQARVRVKASAARRDLTEAKLRRVKTLFEMKTMSRDDLDEAVSSEATARYVYEEAVALLALVEAGPRKEQIEKQRARVLGQTLHIRHIQDRIEKFTIKAYFDGYIVRKHTEVGHWLKSGENVVDVAEMRVVDVRIQVLEDFVTHIAKGMKVRVELGALPNRPFVGEVARVIPNADVRARTFPVEVRLENPEMTGESGQVESHLIKAGMFARGILPVGRPTEALLVRKDAIVLDGERASVWVVTPDPTQKGIGKVQQFPVELGVADGQYMQIIGTSVKSGQIKPGDLVVVKGNERMDPRRPVAIREVLVKSNPR